MAMLRMHALVFLAAPLFAAAVDPVNKSRDNVALKGHDPVAYFTESKPVKGSAEFTHTWNGATWRFASAANRDTFAKDPAKYAPQFGGYCAWAVSKNYTADVDPEAWKIVGDKLYLNYSKSVQRMWEKELYDRIQSAEKNWPGLHK